MKDQFIEEKHILPKVHNTLVHVTLQEWLENKMQDHESPIPHFA
jgi:hypothetical protein